MTEEIYNEMTNKIQESYLKISGLQAQPVGFDWKTIIDMILSILGGCFMKTGDDIKTAATNPTPLQRFIVERNVRQQMRERYGFMGYARYNGDAVCKTILEVASTTDPAKIDLVRQAC